MENIVCTVVVIKALNPGTPMSDQDTISPYKINTL